VRQKQGAHKEEKIMFDLLIRGGSILERGSRRRKQN
jgi:hypothetical protein